MGSKMDGYIASLVTLLFSLTSFAASAIIPTMVNFIDERRLLRSPIGLAKGSKTKSTEALLLSLWTIGLCVTAILVLSISLTANFKFATALIAVNGVPWAVTNWVPFALIGHHLAEDCPRAASTYEQAEDDTPELSGSISGLHNVAISAPQILAAMVYGGVLGISRALGSDFGINWVLRIGGIANIAAACVAFRAVAGRGWDNSRLR
jgi:solute carrier family 45, member 1/2/4